MHQFKLLVFPLFLMTMLVSFISCNQPPKDKNGNDLQVGKEYIMTQEGLESIDSPPDSMIIDDWNAYLAKNKDCLEHVKFGEVKILGKSVEGKISKVIILVTGDWISSRDPGYFGGPCAGFSRSKGRNQTKEETLIYRHFDTGWRLEDI